MIEYGPAHIALRSDSDTGGYVVLADAYYPGWTVSVDGVPAELLRADCFFRATPVTAGEHVVRYDYAPLSLRPCGD